MKYPNMRARVIDQGLFVSTARALAKDIGTVEYCVPWQRAFPKFETSIIGKGYEELTLVDSIWRNINDVDLFIFLDVNHGPEQEELVKRGKLVWGSRTGEDLELDRVGTKLKMERLGLPVGDYKVCRGVTALREELQGRRNVWVKASKFRTWESFQEVRSYQFIKPRIDEIEWRLGPAAEDLEFIVEANLPNKFEIAVDTYTIDGVFPKRAMYGVENKSTAYIGMVTAYGSIPEPLTRYDRAISPYLRSVGYRGDYAAETRIGQNLVPFMVDHCARKGSPPSELQSGYITNQAEIYVEGAQGRCVDTEAAAKFGAEIIIRSTWGEKAIQEIACPDEYREFLKLRNCYRKNGREYILPMGEEDSGVGAVIGWGDTIEEAVARVREVASTVEGISIEMDPKALDGVIEEIERARSWGLDVLRK
jgi:hypothetical protein